MTGPSRRFPARLAALAAALALGLSVVAPLGVALVPAAAVPVLAGAPELQITADARYDVLPAKARVHITVDATVTNTHRDTGTARTYYDTAYLAVLPGTANFRVSSPGAQPRVSIREQAHAYTLLTINLGRRLYAGRHTPLELQFDLPDLGGTAIRDVRVGASLVAFPVWAFATADTPGGSVMVVFPPGYNVQQQVGSLSAPADAEDGGLVYSSGELDEPLAFYAYFVADRPGAFIDTHTSSTVAGDNVSITVRAWSDDSAWGSRTTALVKRALPALAAAIGLPYAGTGLVLQESASRTIGGYAGLYDPVASAIQIAYYAGPFVVLHEVAHAWFNGRLAADRWILEAFASWYADRAAEALKLDAEPPALTAGLRKAAIPLNAWPAIGRAEEATEDYAYAATFQLARAIAGRAGAAGLQSVWRAAVDGEDAYQPVRAGAAAEQASVVPDWRGVLDLLEERTGATYADLWRTWVVRPAEARLLDERSAARKAYAAAVAAAGGWELPPAVRRAMSAWQFGQAQSLIVASRAVLGQRATIAGAAADAGLTPPPTLQAAFEGADGPAAAASEADRELETIDALTTAATTARAAGDPFAQVGLIGQNPDADLAAARSAFERGDLAAAGVRAATAQAIWQSAEERGRGRVISIVVVALGLAVLVVAMYAFVRARRRGRAADDWRDDE